VRAGIIAEMSDCVMKKIFNGHFPVYAYMYTLRQFIRINRISKADIDEFVTAVSGKNLSIRQIETLAHGYFKGSEDFRKQIKNGNISWSLSRLKDRSVNPTDCTQIERTMLKDLEIVQKYMQRVISRSRDTRYKSNVFFAQSNLITGGILRQLEIFAKSVRQFHDKCGHRSKTTLITSNLGFSQWTSFLKNDNLTAALMDRLTENSHIINMKNCVSLRQKLDSP
jgi:hypothetical protein